MAVQSVESVLFDGINSTSRWSISTHVIKYCKYDVLHIFKRKATTNSDVDVEVEFSSTPDFDRFIELQFYLEGLLHAPVDLMTKASIRPEIAAHIDKEAIRAA